MRILHQIIDKKLSNYTILKNNNQDIFAQQEYISAYLLSLFFLGIKDKNIIKKEKLWNKFILSSDKKYLIKLLSYKPTEDNIIFQALNKLDDIKEDESNKNLRVFDNFSWAILSYEHEVAR